jgi:SpoVK/Ycf46/Vps4 family AAA+-type ATPase
MNLIPYIKACYPVLYIVTAEEARAELAILNAAKELKRKIVAWSHTEGFSVPGKDEHEQIEDPIEALTRLKSDPPETIFIMRDFHMFLTVPKTIRQVRDIARDFKQTRKTMIMISPVKKLPPELERDVTVLEFDLPKREDIEQIFTALYNGNKKKIGEITADEQERIIQAAMGLTTVEAESAFAKAIVENASNGTKDVPISKLVMKEKANTVKKTGILEYFEAKQTVNDVGGLENLKEWLTMRSKAFSKQARDFGLPMPRGILLVGLPGCGKSLSAKAASNILGVPLLRFDIGRVFGGLVGESESNMRTAIQTAEAVGSCVLWIDEMEKAFAGMGGSGSTDGGTSQRVFGNFITWMQEKTTPCFIISTVNRIEGLPPELLRKGRFDETFFVGLPSEKEREAILQIHIQKYGRKLKDFNAKEITECVKASDGFSGAELEEAVVSALYVAFHHERELQGDDILKAIKNTNPLSKSKAKELEAMASWAESNALNASKIEKKEKATAQAGRQLEI